MKSDDLSITCGVAALLAFLVGYLHEIARGDGHPDVGIVVLVIEVGRDKVEVESFHCSGELVSNVIRL